MLFHTIPDILSYANEAYGADDAIRWKKSKNEIESRTYSELKNDTDSFANAIEKLGKKGQHIAVIGLIKYKHPHTGSVQKLTYIRCRKRCIDWNRNTSAFCDCQI